MAKSSAPAAPDPYTTAEAQYDYGSLAAEYNAALNNVNTVGPTGSTNYAITGYSSTGAPIYTETTSLTAPEQNILAGSQQVQQGANTVALGQQGVQTAQQGLQLGAAGAGETALGSLNAEQAAGVPQTPGVVYGTSGYAPTATSINTSGVPGIVSPMAGEQYGQSTALAGEMAALQPSQSQQMEQLQAQLINSGNGPGTPAYENAMAQLNAQQGQQDTQAAGAAITAGTGLSNSLFNQSDTANSQLFGEAQAQEQAQNAGSLQQYQEGMGEAQLQNSGISQELADYAQQVGIPLSTLTSLNSILGASSGGVGGTGSAAGGTVSVPGGTTAGGGQVQAPNLMQAFENQYQGQLAGYNANVATDNADTGAAATIAAGAIEAAGASF